MNLKNQIVLHRVFGKGKIIEHSEEYLTISFDCGEKKFIFPDAFNNFISAQDAAIAEQIDSLLKEAEENKLRIRQELKMQQRAVVSHAAKTPAPPKAKKKQQDIDEYLVELNDLSMEIQTLLAENTEWKERYIGYSEEISANIDFIQSARQRFRKWAPFTFYLNVSNAKKAGSGATFEMRYLGQTVAKLLCGKNVLIDTNDFDKTNKRDFDCDIQLSKSDWSGKEASTFRSYFKNRDDIRNTENNTGNHEHRLESLLLSEFSKTTAKALSGIQPVLIEKMRFPMPTPISASNHKRVKYTGVHGGGIDIFARVGVTGQAARLCVIELKDENIAAEPPRDAIKQGLAYAVFIRELLRSESGENWWKLFGFSKHMPQKLTILAACAMPSNENDDVSFEGKSISIGEDTIKLHYIYFSEEDNCITDIKTSLNKVKEQA